MKSLITSLLLLLSFVTYAQKWMWGVHAVSDSTRYKCIAMSLTVDSNGNIYETGTFYKTISFGTTTLATTDPFPVSFLVKYNPTGSVIWAKEINYDGLTPWELATDRTGSVYVAASFAGSFVFAGATLKTTSGSDICILKYDSNGNEVWGTSPTISCSNCTAEPKGIITDAGGNVYVTGGFSNNITFGSYNLSSATNLTSANEYLVKYSPSGKVLWANCATANSSTDYIGGYSIAISPSGYIYTSGTFKNSISIGSVNLSGGYYGSAYLAKFDSSTGNILWAETFPIQNPPATTNTLAFNSITCDINNNVIMTGDYEGTITIGNNSFTCASNDQKDFYLAKFDGAGNVKWAKSGIISAGPGQDSFGYNVTTNKWEDIYLSGLFFDSVAFDEIRLKTLDLSLGNAFIIKLDSAGNTICADTLPDGAGMQGVVADPLSNAVYCLQNITGSFTSGATTFSAPNNWIFLGKWMCSTCPFTASAHGGDSVCAGKPDSLFASGASYYAWSPSDGLSSAYIPNTVAAPLVTTQYTVGISNGKCVERDTVTLPVYKIVQPAACCNTTIEAGKQIQLNASGGISYSWSPAGSLSCSNCPDPFAMPLVNTTYTLVMTSNKGCISDTTITIDVSCSTVFVPEAFSPNGDGQNDVLYVRGDCIQTLDFKVYDRWGNKVFETNDKNIGWDGRCRSEPMNSGSYVYYVTTTVYDGTTQTKKGNVVLVR